MISKPNMKCFILIFFAVLHTSVFAEEAASTTVTPSTAPAPIATPELIQEPRLPFWSIITDIPDTAVLGLRNSFTRRDAIPGWAVVIGSTALLYHYDEDILEDVQSKGRKWGWGNSVNYKAVWNVGNTTLFAAPTDTAGWLYFMGDGAIPITVSVAMIGTGYFNSNNHLYNTGIEMVDGLLTGSVFDQVIKRIAGRESPSAKTEPRGAWHPFPNLKKYSQNTSKYDAMASGHIMTATVMFTVIQEEYPQYNAVWYPLEIAWIGVLGFGMVNVGVHWASDYPLGIGMGYVFGKSAVELHHPERYKKSAHIRYFPGVDEMTGVTTFNAMTTY